MREDIKNLWVTALTSGKYRQTQGTLHEPYPSDSYCCLGVLCEIIKKDFNKGRPKGEKILRRAYKGRRKLTTGIPSESRRHTGNLPSRVAEYVGLNYENINLLIEMNDDNGDDFAVIANWVKENM